MLTAHPSLLTTNVSTLETQVQHSLMRERLVSALSSASGVLALALACIGLYGTLAYAVARRTCEIGIRMALGATRSRTIWLILREALLLTGGVALAALPVLTLGHMASGPAGPRLGAALRVDTRGRRERSVL